MGVWSSFQARFEKPSYSRFKQNGVRHHKIRLRSSAGEQARSIFLI